MEHAFHGARSVADGAAQIRFRPEREITNRAFDALRSRGPPDCFQLRFGSLQRALKRVIAASDDPAVRKLPADPRILEIFIKTQMEWVGLKFFVLVA